MGDRGAVAALIAVTFLLWMGSRATALALPLVALEQTHATWTTGLVLGAESIPLVTSGWWGARLRDRITTGRTIAALMSAQAAGLAIVPVAACLGRLDVLGLAACGLVVGATSALAAPAVRALLSDLGDRLGPGRAARALTLQDLAHRCTMFLAPPLGALTVGHGHTMALLWSECAAVIGGAAVMAVLPRPSPAPRPPAGLPGPPAGAGILGVLARHRRLAASMTVHATVSATWFAFSLGLSIAGAQTHRPGALIAAGMTGYGLASTATSLAAPWLVLRLPVWPTAVLPALALGSAFLALPGSLGSVTATALLAAAGGAALPIGIGAHNSILATDPPPGPDRRAAFAADQIADGGAGAVGMLVGGAVIGAIGVGPTLAAAGSLQVAVTAAALLGVRRGDRTRPQPTPSHPHEAPTPDPRG